MRLKAGSRAPALAAVAALALAAAGPALAQSSLGIGNAEVAVQPGGPFAGIAATQREFFTALREALVGLKNGSGGIGWLVALSFVYGVFHAAGPGHGKAVISSYMLANEVMLRRGVVLSFASALLQAASALLLVGAGWYLLRGTAMSMTGVAYALEILSYALIAAFGAWLLARKAGRLLARRRPAFRLDFQAPGMAMAYAGEEPRPLSGSRGGTSVLPRASAGLDAAVCTDPAGDACDCGRSHMPDPATLAGSRLGLRAGASAVLAVGLRPCSGAIVVLTFALMNGLYAGGVLSVLAMALGTAITVSVLATLAVFAKDVALRAGGSRRGALFRDAIEAGGALLLLVLGLALLGAALQS